MPKGSYERRSLVVRFWAKVNKQGPIHPIWGQCWQWTGSGPGGYGTIKVGGTRNDHRKVYVHRFSYELEYGPVPDDLQVCHSCDNRKCVNPAHLFLGTAKDNSDDMFSKGRANKPVGERNSATKLTAEEVLEIRRLYLTGNYSQEAIGRYFGVGQHAIYRIVNRSSWKHI